MARFATFVNTPGGFSAARGEAMTRLTGLPAWARSIVLLLAIPGICLLVLSLLAVAASIATLLLLTAPAYAVLRRLTGGSGGGRRQDGSGYTAQPVPRPSRRVDATVVG